VRAGDDVDLPARTVTVNRFDVLRTAPVSATTGSGAPIQVVDVDIEVEVSSGTYVRALARDLGQSLGVGAHLTALRRTRVGAFTAEQSFGLDELTERVARDGVSGIPLIPLADAARAQLPVHEVTSEDATRIGHGQRIAAGPGGHEAVAAIDPGGRLVAILDETRATARPKVVFPVT
jgi:tRNA pseudouridine55 synthase